MMDNIELLLSKNIDKNKFYVLEEGSLQNPIYNQYQPYLNKNKLKRKSFSENFLMFSNSEKCKNILNIVWRSIYIHTTNNMPEPYTLDHPFLVYGIFNNKLEELNLMKDIYLKDDIETRDKNICLRNLTTKSLCEEYITNYIFSCPPKELKNTMKYKEILLKLENVKFYKNDNELYLKSDSELSFYNHIFKYTVLDTMPLTLSFDKYLLSYIEDDKFILLYKINRRIEYFEKRKLDYNIINKKGIEILNKLNLFWQYPVITEKVFYEQNKNDELYFAFPWATLIDKGYDLDRMFHILKSLFKFKDNLYTCCQHIHFRKLRNIWRNLGIKTVYISHKCINEDYLDDIQLKPCPLYAVNIEDTSRNNIFKNVNLFNVKRKYLFSFMGGYQRTNYLSDIRLKIFNLKKNIKSNCFIQYTGDWHFNCDVYSQKQNIKGELTEDKSHKTKRNMYNILLVSSRYTLAPSGSGPNSIRFWEALGSGAIPVLLADTLELPKHELWNKSIVRIPESNIDNLEKILLSIPQEEENRMRINCMKIYNHFKNNYRNISKISMKVKENKKIVKSIKLEHKHPCLFLDKDKQLFIDIVKNSKYYFEFGTGWSTEYVLYNCKENKLVVSIESDEKYYNEFIEKIDKSVNYRLDIKYIDLDCEYKKWGYPGISGRYDNWVAYSSQFNILDSDLIEKIDTILIDGRFRVACMLKIFSYINNKCNIIFNNFLQRKCYNILLKYFNVVNSTDDKSLVVLHKKSNVSPPSKELIKQYEEIFY
jgi:hypothetical protein